MNATEQRTHRTVTQSLQQQVDDLRAVSEELDRRIVIIARAAQDHTTALASLDSNLAGLAGQCGKDNAACDQERVQRSASTTSTSSSSWSRSRVVSAGC